MMSLPFGGLPTLCEKEIRLTRHKYGMEVLVPATIKKAQSLYRSNGNTLWDGCDSIGNG